jgi:hypothetical protein
MGSITKRRITRKCRKYITATKCFWLMFNRAVVKFRQPGYFNIGNIYIRSCMKRLAEKRVREAFNWFYPQVSGTSSPTHIPELVLTSQSEINIKVTNLNYSVTSIFSLTISIWTDFHMDGFLWTAGLLVGGWGSRPRHNKFNVIVTVVTCMQKTPSRISVVSNELSYALSWLPLTCFKQR